jgi:hypothetical protein
MAVNPDKLNALGWRSDPTRIPCVHPEASAGASRGGGPSRWCNRSVLEQARLAAWCAAPPPVVAPVGVSDVGHLAGAIVWGGKGKDGGDTSAGGNTATGGFYPPVYITITRCRAGGTHAVRSYFTGGRASEVWWRRQELNSGPKTVSTPEWG